MRLKRIPKGKIVIRLTNRHNKDCLVHFNKKPFSFIPAKSFGLFNARDFGYEEHFPEMQLYSNLKIEIKYLPKDES